MMLSAFWHVFVCVYNFFPPTPFPPRKEDANKKPTTQYSLQLPAKKDPKETETQSKKKRNYVGTMFGWWFEIFCLFTLTWGNDPNLAHILRMG